MSSSTLDVLDSSAFAQTRCGMAFGNFVDGIASDENSKLIESFLVIKEITTPGANPGQRTFELALDSINPEVKTDVRGILEKIGTTKPFSKMNLHTRNPQFSVETDSSICKFLTDLATVQRRDRAER